MQLTKSELKVEYIKQHIFKLIVNQIKPAYPMWWC